MKQRHMFSLCPMISILLNLVLHLYLSNPLKPGVEWRMKMKLEQHREAMLQPHLSDLTIVSLQRCTLFQRSDSAITMQFTTKHEYTL